MLIYIFSLGFIFSALSCGLILLVAKHLQLGIDAINTKSPQKFHSLPTPRLGGMGIAIGLLSSLYISYQFTTEYILLDNFQTSLMLLIASLPAFLGGLSEDLTGRCKPSIRLILTFVSAAIAWFLIDAQLTRIDFYLLDSVLAIGWLSIIFTMFAVGGVSHSFNIIDGYNGLMGGVSVLVGSMFALLAWQLQDVYLLFLSLWVIAVQLGFLIWNMPWGKLFMGDGGAYLTGFLLAEIALLIIARHSQISPWSVFLIMAYPIVETLFSVYRKKILLKISPFQPDGLHLHMLIYKRLVLPYAQNNQKSKRWSHLVTSLLLYSFACIPMLMSFWAFKSTWQCLLALFIFVLIYLWVYFKLSGIPEKAK